jgi:DNA-binding response OmpR family regulator
MEKKRILMIDDDRLPMQYYIRSLEKNNFEVMYFVRPDDAFEYIDREQPHIDGIILDIMLPPGEKYKDEETNKGLKTGFFVLKDLRNYQPYSNIPVVILTNVRNPKTLAEFTESSLIKIAFKPDYSPKKLVHLLEEMLNL